MSTDTTALRNRVERKSEHHVLAEMAFASGEGDQRVTVQWDPDGEALGVGAWYAVCEKYGGCWGYGATQLEAMAEALRILASMVTMSFDTEMEVYRTVNASSDELAAEIGACEKDLHQVQHLVTRLSVPEDEQEKVSAALRPLWRAEHALIQFGARMNVTASTEARLENEARHAGYVAHIEKAKAVP